MTDADCIDFLQWCLPRLHMRWDGFRKVRGQVCKRIERRIIELNIAGLEAYRTLLERDGSEWEVLDKLCRVTISRFYRDHRVFDRIAREVLPVLEASSRTVRCWSAGCASGEEPYTLAICHRRRSGGSASTGSIEIVATDIDRHMLDRARRGCYQRGTLKELPDDVVAHAFEEKGPDEEPYCIREAFREPIAWQRHDVRDSPPRGPFDLILCRNLAFMYFDQPTQRDVLHRFLGVLRPGGALVIGKHEELPDHEHFTPWFENENIYRRTHEPASTS